IIMCDGNLKPDVFDTMNLLAARTSELLLARDVATREAIETSMAFMAHNLTSRLAALPLVLARYRLAGAKYREIREINDDFEFLITHTDATIKRVRELLADRITVKTSEFNLGGVIKEILHSELDSAQYCFQAVEDITIQA